MTVKKWTSSINLNFKLVKLLRSDGRNTSKSSLNSSCNNINLN